MNEAEARVVLDKKGPLPLAVYGDGSFNEEVAIKTRLVIGHRYGFDEGGMAQLIPATVKRSLKGQRPT